MKKKNLISFYFTKYGLKNIGANQLLGARCIIPIKTASLSTNKLFLGPDFLKDKYTLLDCSIKDSPHFFLMKSLSDGKPIDDTDYFFRYVSGCLDWRRGVSKPKQFDSFQNKFQKSLYEIQTDTYSPIVVYQQGGKYYIFDGKHRAALCSILDLPVKCTIVGSEISNAYLWHYMFSLIKDNPEYTYHTGFHNVYLDELNYVKD